MLSQIIRLAAICVLPALFLLARHENPATYFLLFASVASIILMVFHGFRWEIVGMRYRTVFCAVFLVLAGVSMSINHVLLANHAVLWAILLGGVAGTIAFFHFYRNVGTTVGTLELSSPLLEQWVVA